MYFVILRTAENSNIQIYFGQLMLHCNKTLEYNNKNKYIHTTSNERKNVWTRMIVFERTERTYCTKMMDIGCRTNRLKYGEFSVLAEAHVVDNFFYRVIFFCHNEYDLTHIYLYLLQNKEIKNVILKSWRYIIYIYLSTINYQ